MNNTLIDNSKDELSMVKTLKECFEIPDIKTVRIATGYWDLPGLTLLTDEIITFLEKEGTQLLLLIGKDPYVYASQVNNPKYKDMSYPGDFIRTDINELDPKEEYLKSVRLLLDHCSEEEDSKIQIRIFRKNEEDATQFLHSKCYIFTGNNQAVGIVGSSNFTGKGLEGNAELNYVETNWFQVTSTDSSNPKQKSHIMWFDEKWDISQPWNKIFLEQILKPSPIGTKVSKKTEELTPYEIYIKYLQMQFGDITDESVTAQLKSFIPSYFHPYSFQLDAVKQCFYIMKAHGGFFLSDVVGLGKTIVGVLIIKKFIAEAELWSRQPKVLIVTPPAIKKAWNDTIIQFDKDSTFKIEEHIEFITTGSIGQLIEEVAEETDNEDIDTSALSNDYGMILIDESHNFRNSETQKYKKLDNLIDCIKLQTGFQPLIGLLSATPQNNSPADLKNQIYFFQRSHNNTTLPDIPGGKLDTYFNEKQKLFNENRNKYTPEARQKIKEIAADIHEKVLQYLMVRRTRSDVKTQYGEDSDLLKFPSVKGPISEHYSMSFKLSKLFYDSVSAIIGNSDDGEDSIGYYRYAAISYLLRKEDRELYEHRNLTVERISKQLADIMQLLMVKRLESSFPAFRKSLQNLKQNTQNMIDMIKTDTVFICPNIDVNGIIKKEGSLAKATPIIRNIITKKGGNNKEFHANDLDKDNYLKALNQDMEIIEKLCKRWEKNTEDPKFTKFKEILDSELFNHAINNPNHYDSPRLVIFTEALDTLSAIEKHVRDAGHRPLVVSAKDRDKKQQLIAENFDANYPIDKQKNDFDTIITTEVLAEGVNLHRANVILNYDAPWNATRLMQRIGRVNRIGSKEEFVYVFNFYPSEDGEKIIKYLPKAYAKLQAFHTMFGEDNKVFSEMEELSEADLNNLVDGDTSPFAPYINELKRFAAENPERYKIICKTDPKQLGSFRVIGLDYHLFYVGAENHQFVHILIDKDNQPKIVSPLRFIQAFQMSGNCDEKPGEKDAVLLEEKSAIAVNAFNSFLVQSKRAKDARKIKKSLEQWIFILDHLSDNDAKKAMNGLKKEIANQNSVAIKLTDQLYKELKQGQQSLFGLDKDVNEYVKATFAHISKEVEKIYGEPYISIYQMSKE